MGTWIGGFLWCGQERIDERNFSGLLLRQNILKLNKITKMNELKASNWWFSQI